MLRAGSIDIDDVVFIGDDNPKEHAIGDLHVSFEKYGVIQRIVISDKNRHCIAGEGRVRTLRQARKLGKSPPGNVEVGDNGSWVIPCDFIAIDEQDEAAAAFVLNASQDEGGYDQDRLATLLSRLAANAGNGLAGSGWDAERVDAFVRFVSGDQGDSSGSAPKHRPRKTLICPQCGYHVSG